MDKAYYCRICEENKTWEEMTKNRTKPLGVNSECKACRRQMGRDYYKSLDVGVRSARDKSAYKRGREKYLQCDDEYLIIKHWVDHQCRRRSEKRPQYAGRRQLDKKLLFMMCLESKMHFPYITFKNIREDAQDTGWKWASLDRIDSTQPYSNDNVCIVPMWLNSAKMNMKYEELFNLLQETNTQELKRHLSLTNSLCKSAAKVADCVDKGYIDPDKENHSSTFY